MTNETYFDLASLTKILATTFGMIQAFQDRKIESLDLPLRQFFPSFVSELKNRSLREVLEHRSGLAALFLETPELLSRDDRIAFFLKRVDAEYEESQDAGLENSAALYSDRGFMLLGILLEQIYGLRLRTFFSTFLDKKFLGLEYGPLLRAPHWFSKKKQVAWCLDLETKNTWLKGRVQDPRAEWLEGDAGHSGLFGTAKGVENWGQEIYLSYYGKGVKLSDKSLQTFIRPLERRGDTRFLSGFDTPTRAGISQAGKYFSRDWTIGHLGYTGASFWMDLEKGYRVTLLSERFSPDIDPELLGKLRPAFHDWLFEEVFSKLKP